MLPRERHTHVQSSLTVPSSGRPPPTPYLFPRGLLLLRRSVGSRQSGGLGGQQPAVERGLLLEKRLRAVPAPGGVFPSGPPSCGHTRCCPTLVKQQPASTSQPWERVLDSTASPSPHWAPGPRPHPTSLPGAPCCSFLGCLGFGFLISRYFFIVLQGIGVSTNHPPGEPSVLHAPCSSRAGPRPGFHIQSATPSNPITRPLCRREHLSTETAEYPRHPRVARLTAGEEAMRPGPRVLPDPRPGSGVPGG